MNDETSAPTAIDRGDWLTPNQLRVLRFALAHVIGTGHLNPDEAVTCANLLEMLALPNVRIRLP